MLTVNGTIVGKDFTDHIEVDGINIFEVDASQFSLYTLISATDEVKEILGIEDGKEQFMIFPFQCGIKFFADTHLLNIRDCLGVVTRDEIEKLVRG